MEARNSIRRMLHKLQVITLALSIISTTALNTAGQIRCQIGGCSGTLCMKEGEDIVGACDWKDSYACYQPARNLTQCVATPAGNCEWKQTKELESCLAANNNEPATKCQIGGCSGTLCMKEGEIIVDACVWKDSDACYG